MRNLKRMQAVLADESDAARSPGCAVRHPPRPRHGVRKWLALILIAACANRVSAQEVSGTVRSASDQKPVPGAIVVLTAQSGARVNATLTNDSGGFRLRVPAPGQFGLRVDVVGYESVTVPPFQLDSGATSTRDVLFPFARVRLPAVAVSASTVCARVSEDAGDAPRLWSEARKALEATRLAIDEQRFMIALRRFERTIGPDSVLRSSRTWTQSGVTQNPFETLSPETVARSGFKVGRDTSELYYGPDAAVLLSDTFVEAHCFGTRRGGPAGAIGLTFRPQRVGQLVDISGVLWLDSATAELRTLEYRYVPSIGAPNVAGGFVTFGRLPSGVWGVQRWSIRLPVLHVTQSSRRPDGAFGQFVDTITVAVREVGGEVIAGGASAATSSDGRLVGTVFDSTLAAPLPNAVITIEGIGRNAQTDVTGSFVVDSLAEEGEFRIRFWHPRLDSLGIPAPVSRHRLRRRGENVAELAVPGVATIGRDRCGRRTSGVQRVIMGTLRSAENASAPVPATDVVLLERRVTTLGADSLVRHDHVTSDLGRYAFCGVQAGSQSWLVARVGTEWTEPRLVHGDSARPVEIVPLRGPSLATSPSDSSAPNGAPAVLLGRTIIAGTSRISGWILQPEHSEASVQVLVDNVVRTTASKDGAFSLDKIAPGARRISFRANRLAVRHITVIAEPGQAQVLLVALREAPLVVVRRESPSFDQQMAEFRKRRRAGGGVFLERPEIEKRNPRTLTVVLRTVPGIKVVSHGSGYRYVSSHFRRLSQEVSAASEAGLCDLMVYLDGQPFPMDFGDADSRIRVTELAAMEVYVSAGSVPRQFAGVNAACGVIMLWRG
jgi:hypothetical protein